MRLVMGIFTPKTKKREQKLLIKWTRLLAHPKTKTMHCKKVVDYLCRGWVEPAALERYHQKNESHRLLNLPWGMLFMAIHLSAASFAQLLLQVS